MEAEIVIKRGREGSENLHIKVGSISFAWEISWPSQKLSAVSS